LSTACSRKTAIGSFALCESKTANFGGLQMLQLSMRRGITTSEGRLQDLQRIAVRYQQQACIREAPFQIDD
jgi:hypothetical protein